VPEKTNEITAIPDLLDHLAETKQLEGALVAIDAMGCQVAIADKIVAHKADYLLALKGNQPTLEADVEDYFGTAPANELATTTSLEKGHGRIETRTYTGSSNVDWIVSERSYPGQPRFKTIKTILKVHAAPNTVTAAASRPVSTSHLRRSTSNASPARDEVIGASKACIGCSMSSSKTIFPATDPATVPKTWPSYGASHSIWCAPTKPREASKPAGRERGGTPNS
jgi:predicted transposase YbfD/YdcC